ncbi:hypothetical protein CDL12_04770 [Handroanthus impetiginosus]|uniref:TF-B3 domain-containing protein n=1 Tax=Handroanthus impetiginosus TaxID=429701 RepID=A0A2G9HYG5_9LAMI|nr:hypothetical protein CDL12_04770 [Handroanthus impetiginosus]
MPGLDGDVGIGCSANNRRWEWLTHVVTCLSKGKTVQELIDNGGDVGIGCSADDKRWDCLVYVAERLSEGKTAQELIDNGGDVAHDVITIKKPTSKNLDNNPPKTGEINEKINTNDVENVVTDVIFSQDSDSKKPSSKNTAKEKEGASKKRAKKTSDVMDPAPDLPQAFKNHILNRGCDLESVVLVTQKELTRTDVSTGHVAELDKEKGRVEAILFQPCLKECVISLRNWKSNLEYALVHNWKEVCSKNGLKEGMKIQLWSFRRNTELCFALVRLG